jgi:hypothetical protein
MAVEHVQPDLDEQTEAAARAAARARFNRNQAIGILLVLLAALAWRLLHANLSWLFPPGWWRL